MPRRLTAITKVTGTPGYECFTLRWIRHQVYNDGIPSYRIGGRVFIDLDELDALVEAGRRDPVAKAS